MGKPLQIVPELMETKQHRLAPLTGTDRDTLRIHEIYRSLQGESLFAGLPCVFIRTTACHLRCSWCDTPHAFKQGELMPREAILQQALAFSTDLVELTGGEPLLQEGVRPLMQQLADHGKTVLLETSGAATLAGVDPRVHIIMDLKCPDSGEAETNLWENLSLLKPTDEIKFVIASRKDWDWAIEAIRKHQLDQRFALLASAVFTRLSPAELAEWVLASQLKIRMQLQMHKYIWDPNARGV